MISLGLWRVSDIVFSCALPETFDPFPKGHRPNHLLAPRHGLRAGQLSTWRAWCARTRRKSLPGGTSARSRFAGERQRLHPSRRALVFEQRHAIRNALCDEIEREILGFTHADSGRILGEAWKLSPDIVTVLQYHHDIEAAPSAKDLVALVHLSDLFCREHGLGHGYHEARQIDFKCSPAWLILVQTCRQMGTPLPEPLF